MKIYPILLLLLLTTGILHAQNPQRLPPQPASTAAPKNDASAALATLQKPYNEAIAAIDAENQKSLLGVETWYLANLEKMQKDYIKAGDLDGAVAVKKEREWISAHRVTTAEQIQAMPAPLRTLRGTYDDSLKKIADDVDRRKVQEGQRYQAGLEALQKRITMSGDLDQALLVKAEKERIAADLAVITPAAVSVPAAPVATPQPLTSKKSDGKADDPTAVLLGTWRFTYLNNHWSGTRTFHKDGTMTDPGFKGVGTWTIGENKIILHYPDGNEEHMVLPLHRAGTKVLNADEGPKVNAVKQ